MKKYLLPLALVALVACSNDDDSKEEKQTKKDETATTTANPVQTPVVAEEPKELTQEEKDASDYEIGYNYITTVDSSYMYYRKIDEKKRGEAFSDDKTNTLYLSHYAEEARAELAELGNVPSLYDKEYEAKLNEFYTLLLESYSQIANACFANYQKSIGDITVQEALKVHEEFVLATKPLLGIRDAAIQYHNDKYPQ